MKEHSLLEFFFFYIYTQDEMITALTFFYLSHLKLAVSTVSTAVIVKENSPCIQFHALTFQKAIGILKNQVYSITDTG